jgi:hypothetical protein
LPLFGPLVPVCVDATLRLRARDAGDASPGGLPGWARWALAMPVAAAVGFAAYLKGVTSGFSWLDDDYCGRHGLAGGHVAVHAGVPVSVRCVVSVGQRGYELVPGWVNPVLFAAIAVYVLACGAAVVSAVRGARSRRAVRTP